MVTVLRCDSSAHISAALFLCLVGDHLEILSLPAQQLVARYLHVFLARDAVCGRRLDLVPRPRCCTAMDRKTTETFSRGGAVVGEVTVPQCIAIIVVNCYMGGPSMGGSGKHGFMGDHELRPLFPRIN